MNDLGEMRYLTLVEAATRAGNDQSSLERRWRRCGMALYVDPKDRRRRLIAEADLAAFLTPVPTGRGRRPNLGGVAA